MSNFQPGAHHQADHNMQSNREAQTHCQQQSCPLDYIGNDTKYSQLADLLQQDWSVLLDSGKLNSGEQNTSAADYKRFDILAFRPTLRINFADGALEINDSKSHQRIETDTPLTIVRKLLKQHQPTRAPGEQLAQLPFQGGLLGYLSYDFGKQFLCEQARATLNSVKAVDDLKLPLLRLGLYHWALITDHHQQTSTIYNFGLEEQDWLEVVTLVKASIAPNSSEKPLNYQVDTFKAEQSFEQYSHSFYKIKDYITAGDCYQINYSQRFNAKFQGDPVAIYSALAKANNSPFSSFINYQDFQILSLSPERFIAVEKDQVVTQPIKGTLPRKPDPVDDQLQADRLKNSTKDKAENLMIVDLLRNDLSRTAAKNSVKVTELFGHYRFESVHHLISTVYARLAPKFDVFDLLTTTLPGGSITGAPKIRAMQIIDELEPVKRGVYCGVIGYIDFQGKMDTNICIRTLLAKNNSLYCWAGGGLVHDSELAAEYQETFDKLNKIIPTLNPQAKANG